MLMYDWTVFKPNAEVVFHVCACNLCFMSALVSCSGISEWESIRYHKFLSVQLNELITLQNTAVVVLMSPVCPDDIFPLIYKVRPDSHKHVPGVSPDVFLIVRSVRSTYE